MRSGHWQRVTFAIALGCAFATGTGRPVSAIGIIHHKTIPREVLAQDFRTGKVMMAPPIPYGCYAMDPLGAVHNAGGMAFGAIHGIAGKIHGICEKCGGGLCGICGGNGSTNGRDCNACGGDGCSNCGDNGLAGHCGLFHHKDRISATDSCSLFGHHRGGAGQSCIGLGCGMDIASAQSAPVAPAKTMSIPSAQVYSGVIASSQMPAVCGGCLGMGRTARGAGCGLCGGRGFLGFGHGGSANSHGSACGNCGGRGCGLCGGMGLGHNKGNACSNCGGAGCALCSGGGGLKSHLLGLPMGLVNKALHRGEIQYFVGAGGPVPLTPGYVPYINPVRSPRDYFAFPPFSDQVP